MSNESESIYTIHAALTKSNVPQRVIPSNPNRKAIIIQNISNESLWIRFKKKADFNPNLFRKWPSTELMKGETFVTDGALVINESVSIIGKKVGSRYFVKEVE